MQWWMDIEVNGVASQSLRGYPDQKTEFIR
jgi:hypothetical protein